jgi:hypothetical protein
LLAFPNAFAVGGNVSQPVDKRAKPARLIGKSDGGGKQGGIKPENADYPSRPGICALISLIVLSNLSL